MLSSEIFPFHLFATRPERKMDIVAIATVFLGLLLVDVGVFAATNEEGHIKLLDEAPEWLKPCRRKDPNLNTCLRDTFQFMFPALAAGIPEIHVSRFEPLYINKLSLSKGHGPVTVSGSFYNILAHGPSNASATSVMINFEKGIFDLGVFLPDIRIEADYDLRGKILVLPLVGTGPARVHLKNVTTKVTTRFDLPKIQGREVIHVKHMKVDFDIDGMSIHLENLFNGNKVLGRTLNNFLNKNAQEVVSELKEPLGDSFAVFFKELMNKALMHIPLDIWIVEDSITEGS